MVASDLQIAFDLQIAADFSTTLPTFQQRRRHSNRADFQQRRRPIFGSAGDLVAGSFEPGFAAKTILQLLSL
jgi:hypothetical protein